nr:hypothetical protein [Tanacetum cinerariifolium]
MTSFGYRLNPRYAIKECLSCGALYTGDFCCSKGNVEDKILVPKLPKNYARCARCGHPDHGVNPPHIDECCCECGAALDGIYCQQCICKSCGKILACCDDDDDYNSPFTPVLSTEKPDNSLNMGYEHLDTIPAMESDEVIKSSVEDLVPIPSESKGIPDTICDVHFINNPTPLEAKDHFEIVINFNDDISSSDDDSLYNENIDDDDSLYNENIEYVEASPRNSELVSLESSSTSPKSFLDETNTFHNSLSEFENFYFDLKEISSGSTTTHSDISLSDYEVFYFYDDHIEEISSGNTTTHFDNSLSEYDSVIFDLSNDQFPPTNRSDLLMRSSAMNLPTSYLRLIEDDHSPLLAYVVWIFLAYLAYPVIPPYLYSFENEDTIFDPGITINHFFSFKPDLSHRCRTFKKFNTHRSHLNENPMEMLFSTFFPMDQ